MEMTEMTPAQIAAMVADREAGTLGPWTDDTAKIEDAEDYSVDREDDNGSGLCWSAVGHYGMTVALVVVPSSFGMDKDQAANARRIARVPELEATVIAQAAEIIEEQRISDERGNHIEFTLLPEMAAMTMQLAERDAEIARLTAELASAQMANKSDGKIVVDMAGAMDKMTPEFMATMAPLFATPIVAMMEKELAGMYDRAEAAEAKVGALEVLLASPTDTRELSEAERFALSTLPDAPMATMADMTAALEAADTRVVTELPRHIAVRHATHPSLSGKIVIRNMHMDDKSDMVVIEPEHIDAVIDALRALKNGDQANE